ncbi:MAG: flagellar hook-associated protein FlgK [Bacteroidota bacterium]
MSIHQLFEISRRSLRAIDAQMNVAGQNVANENVEGFSRRRAVLSPNSVDRSGIHTGTLGVFNGLGVSVTGFERMRDSMLADAARHADTSRSAADQTQQLLSQLEGVMPGEGTGSINAVLDQFFNAWSDLANNPNDNGVRATVRGQAQTLAATLNHSARQLESLETQSMARLTDQVDDANELLGRLADLNGHIDAARAAGLPDLAAEDERDRLVRELGQFVPVEIEPKTSGYSLTVGGMNVLSGDDVTAFRIDTAGATPQVMFGDTGVAFAPKDDGGQLGALVRFFADGLTEAQTMLDTLASTIVTEVNALHQTGFGLDGTNGRDFFDPTGVTAANIALDADILADLAHIGIANATDAPGDNTIALQIADLRAAELFNGGTDTAEDFTINYFSALGGRIEHAQERLVQQEDAMIHLDAMEQGISGVSVEEEMTNLIQLQQSYGAAARVLNSAQSMFDTLLAI